MVHHFQLWSWRVILCWIIGNTAPKLPREALLLKSVIMPGNLVLANQTTEHLTLWDCTKIITLANPLCQEKLSRITSGMHQMAVKTIKITLSWYQDVFYKVTTQQKIRTFSEANTSSNHDLLFTLKITTYWEINSKLHPHASSLTWTCWKTTKLLK